MVKTRLHATLNPPRNLNPLYPHPFSRHPRLAGAITYIVIVPSRLWVYVFYVGLISWILREIP